MYQIKVYTYSRIDVHCYLFMYICVNYGLWDFALLENILWFCLWNIKQPRCESICVSYWMVSEYILQIWRSHNCSWKILFYLLKGYKEFYSILHRELNQPVWWGDLLDKAYFKATAKNTSMLIIIVWLSDRWSSQHQLMLTRLPLVGLRFFFFYLESLSVLIYWYFKTKFFVYRNTNKHPSKKICQWLLLIS